MDNFGDSSSGGFAGEGDPAAEFLAREQEELAGLEDEIPVVMNNGNSNGPPPVTNGISNNNSADRRSPSPVFADQQSSQPSAPRVVREEPEKIKRWREEQGERLKKKDEEEEKKKGEMREQARKELDEWYKNHDEQLVKTRSANRSAEKELVADTEPMAPGTEWERIAKLCDFNPKASKHTKDISRLRSIILQVKQTPPVKAIKQN